MEEWLNCVPEINVSSIHSIIVSANPTGVQSIVSSWRLVSHSLNQQATFTDSAVELNLLDVGASLPTPDVSR